MYVNFNERLSSVYITYKGSGYLVCMSKSLEYMNKYIGFMVCIQNNSVIGLSSVFATLYGNTPPPLQPPPPPPLYTHTQSPPDKTDLLDRIPHICPTLVD